MEQWSEVDSKKFLDIVDVITPSRDEQMAMLISLVPAAPAHVCQIVELGCGGGDLAAKLLTRFPNARYLGLDGSDTMLQSAGERLQPYGNQVTLHRFRLEELNEWPALLPQPVHCFVSSLVIHHLTDEEKQVLYRTLYDRLGPGGALLLIDVVLPTSRAGREALAANWDAVVKEQSLALTGSLATYHQFRDEQWNCYPDPEPMDRPASLFTQLCWLEQAGFVGVDCFWQRAGHALFGGFKPLSASF